MAQVNNDFPISHSFKHHTHHPLVAQVGSGAELNATESGLVLISDTEKTYRQVIIE